MTDLTPPDDEILSAYLDGEATPDEVVRIEGDPALLARLAELRAAAALVAEPVAALAASDVDRLVSAALVEGDTADGVVDLRAERVRRDRFRQRLVTVAAGVLVLGLAVPVLLAINNATNGDGDGFQTADVATDDAGADGAGGAENEESLDESAPDDLQAEGAEFGLSADTDAMGEGEAAALDATDAPAEETGLADEPSDDSSPLAARAMILPGGLGPYPDGEALVADLEDIWAAREPGASPPEGEANFIEPLPCGPELVDYLDWPDAAIDLTIVEVDGEVTTLALADLGDGTGVAALATEPECLPHELAVLSDE